MSQDPLFISRQEQNEFLRELFKQRKKWFIHSLSLAVESVTSDKLIYQMFQTPSSELYIPDRVCEIVTQSIEDDREIFINELFNYLRDKGNSIDLEEFQRVGSELLNLSTQQIQIEMEQRNQIKQLSTSNDLNYKNNKKNYKNIRRKLTFLNSLCLTIAQEMRAFKRRFPILIVKYKSMLNSSLSDYLMKTKLIIDDLKTENKNLKSENSRLTKINENTTKEVVRLNDSLQKYQSQYQELKNEKSQSDSLFESYLEHLKSTQQNLENERNEKVENLKAKLAEQSTEIDSLKKQIKMCKQQIMQDQQEIDRLNKTIQNKEEVISSKIESLIISQQVMIKLKDEFEKVYFVLSELKKISFDSKNEDIKEKVKFIKSKIKSKKFEIQTINELKEKCLQFLMTKEKVKENLNGNLSDIHTKELSTLIEICTDFTLQSELHEVLFKLNEKFKINSDNEETISKILRQLNKKTKENQRLSIVNQKLQCQKDDLQQQIGEIKMQLRSNPSLSPFLTPSSRIVFTPSKSEKNFSHSNIEMNRTPRNYAKSDIINTNNQTFDDSASPILLNKTSYLTDDEDYDDDDGDDEGENELFENEHDKEKQSHKKIYSKYKRK